jgi:anaerobic magnesium-protoporphyrin IX monomethyl ester cyclase
MRPRLDVKKTAFITQPSMFTAYTGTRIDVATQIYPIQAFMWLSAYVKKVIPGFKTTVCDMGVMDQRNAWAWKEYVRFLQQERPRYVCFTVTTPIYYEAKLAGIIAKQILGPDVIVVHGGVHASHLYHESLTDSMCDVVVRGEGEITFAEICEGKLFKEISGIAYRTDQRREMFITADEIVGRLEKGESAYAIQCHAVASYEPEVVVNSSRRQMRRDELDQLPFQDLELYKLWRYRNSRIIAKSHPLIQYETSRGCPEQCSFCSAATDNYRILSADRVVEELRYYSDHGIKEVRFNDDQFLASVPRAEEIAEKVLQSGLRFDFNLAAGIRADKCSRKFLEHFKRAGLYQAAAGFESGDQESLDSIKKNLNLERSIEAMAMFREVGIEVIGFFMIGTPADTFRSMQATIDFAKRLMPDYGKVTICIPFPDTPLYHEYDQQGLINKPERWDLYNIHRAADVYTHPNPKLTPEVLNAWYRKFYREFYSNPRYIAKQVSRSWRNGSFAWKAELAVRTFIPSAFRSSTIDDLRATYESGPADPT